jgi:hypothetical protein
VLPEPLPAVLGENGCSEGGLLLAEPVMSFPIVCRLKLSWLLLRTDDPNVEGIDECAKDRGEPAGGELQKLPLRLPSP